MNERVQVLCGDARAVLAGMEDASVDAVVTDPPAGVSFMNLAFDSDRGGRDQWVAWLAGILEQCRRVVKPGGYALVWALPRTSHWTALAIEDAGWTIRDSVAHLFGSGFPKSRSCLKPAHEVWWLAKAPGPLQPLQIDACRVPAASHEDTGRAASGAKGNGSVYGSSTTYDSVGHPSGRWPGNVVLSHVPPAPDGTGGCRPTGMRRVRGNGHYPAARGAGGLGTSGHAGQRDLAERHMDDEQVQAWSCVDGSTITVPSYAGSFGALSPLDAPASLLDQLASLIRAARACSTSDSTLLRSASEFYRNAHRRSADSWDGPSGAAACALGLSKLLGSLGDCPSCRRFCDGHVHQIVTACQEDVPSLVDALSRVHQALCARAHTQSHQSEVQRSSDGDAPRYSSRPDSDANRTAAVPSHASQRAPADHTVGTEQSELPRSAPHGSTDVSSISVGGTHRTCTDSAHTFAAVRLLSLLSADLAWRFLLPAHIIQRTEIDINLPLCPVMALDEQAGPCTSGAKALHHVRTTTKGKNNIGSGKGNGILQARPEEYPASTGSASRFFATLAPEPEDAVPFMYCAKASRREREAGGVGDYRNSHPT